MTDDVDHSQPASASDRRERPGEQTGRQFEAGATDIAAWRSNFMVRIDLPGIDESELSLNVMNLTLEITAEREQVGSARVERYLSQERQQNRVTRSITLPNTVDPTEMSAEYERGVLTVLFPNEASERPESA